MVASPNSDLVLIKFYPGPQHKNCFKIFLFHKDKSNPTQTWVSLHQRARSRCRGDTQSLHKLSHCCFLLSEIRGQVQSPAKPSSPRLKKWWKKGFSGIDSMTFCQAQNHILLRKIDAHFLVWVQLLLNIVALSWLKGRIRTHVNCTHRENWISQTNISFTFHLLYHLSLSHSHCLIFSAILFASLSHWRVNTTLHLSTHTYMHARTLTLAQVREFKNIMKGIHGIYLQCHWVAVYSQFWSPAHANKQLRCSFAAVSIS